MIKHKNIEVPKVGEYDFDPDKLEKVVVKEFEYAFDKSKPFHKRIGAFIRGENKAGRTVGMVLDGLSLFIPRLRTARNFARHLLIKKQKAMIKDKPWYQSKTIWSAIMIVITAILQTVGVDVVSNPELMQTIYEVAYILAGAFGLVGLRSAIGEKINK